jgi:pimeloyl-ACP methyl ester carboxylesterase
MSRRVLFVQGAGPGTHDDWDDKLAGSLRLHLGSGWEVSYPRMPGEGDPHPADWKAAVRRELDKLSDGDVLVGHSFGGSILLRTLVDAPPPFAPALLVLLAAPFYGAGGWESAETELPTDAAQRLPRAMPIRLYHGTRDDDVPFAHLQLCERAIPQAETVCVPDGTHQFEDDLEEVARAIARLTANARRQA